MTKLLNHYKCFFPVIVMMIIALVIWSLVSMSRWNISECEDNIELVHGLNPLIFTITTFAYSEFAKNWALSLEMHGMNNFIIFCADTKCYDSIKCSGYRVELIKNIISNDDGSEALLFKTRSFANFVGKRPEILSKIYLKYFNNNRYNAILYLDCDISILHDFIPLLERKYLYINNNTMYDIMLQTDVDSLECNKKSSNYCTCFMLIPFSNLIKQKIIRFMDEWIKQINIYYDKKDDKAPNGNQVPFNKAINYMIKINNKLNIATVDCTEFPNGFLLKNEMWTNKNMENFQMIHANYLVGPIEKKKLLKKFNVWYLNDRPPHIANDFDLNLKLWSNKDNENERGMSFEQYAFIGSTISFTPNMIKNTKINIIIFSVHYDSLFYLYWNPNGRNIYLENSQIWIDKIKEKIKPIELDIFHVNYTTLTSKLYDLEKKLRLSTTFWDIIIVDAPGTFQAIYMASYLMNNSLKLDPNGIVHVFIHDFEREIQVTYSKLYIRENPNIVIRPEKKALAYYKITN